MTKEKSESLPQASGVLRHEGIFDHEALYKATSAWAEDYGYHKMERDMTRKYAPDGGEYKIKWLLVRNADDYVRYEVAVEIWVWKGIEVTVEEQGKKVKRTKGTVDVIMKSKLIKNYEKDFGPTRWPQFIRQITERFFRKQLLEDHEKKLYREFLDLQNRYKEILNYPT